jgi:hypothetical protein
MSALVCRADSPPIPRSLFLFRSWSYVQAMTEPADPFFGYLSDYMHDRLRIACGPCGRDGDYRVKSLRTMLGNPPMEEVPRLLAIKAGCALATRFPGHECRANFVSPLAETTVQFLSTAYHAGWQLTLKCDRSRQGLKSIRPCRFHPFLLDLGTLVSALGHEFPADQLARRLVCPGCGSHSFSLSWISSKAPPAEPVPIRQSG